MTRLDFHREMSEAPRDMIAMQRLIRRLKITKERWRTYAGYRIGGHQPPQINLYSGKSIVCLADGSYRWTE